MIIKKPELLYGLYSHSCSPSHGKKRGMYAVQIDCSITRKEEKCGRKRNKTTLGKISQDR